MPSTTPSHWAAAVGCLLAFATTVPGQSAGRRGIIVSEIHHQSVGDGLPTYIELVNLDPGNTVGLANAMIEIRGAGGGVAGNFTIPAGTMSAFQPTVNLAGTATPGTGTITLVDGAGPPIPFPVEGTIVASALFPSTAVLDPNLEWTVCVAVPNPAVGGFLDQVFLNGLSGGPCTALSQWNGPPVDFSGGAVIRGYRVDSNTAEDFITYPALGIPPGPPDNPFYQGPPVTATPTIVNPEMARVTGFFFGSPGNDPGDPGIQFFNPVIVPPPSPFGSVSGVGTAVGAVAQTLMIDTINSPPPDKVAWVEFKDHPYDDSVRQRNPIFDPVIPNGELVTQMTLTGQDLFLGHRPAGPGVPPVAPGGATWDLIVPSTTPTGTDGVLNIDMGPLEQADLGFQIFQPAGGATSARQLRIERILTDFTSDGMATGTGNLSPVQIDIIPSEGDIWCEMILYDGNGFSYRAKVRNWPSNPLSCTNPQLGLGSNAVGNLDIIALCFDEKAELYVLPTATTAGTTGTGPLFGIIPDPLTFGFLGLPFGIDPAHVQTTVDGLYFYSITDGGLSGMSFDIVAVQWGGANLSGAGFTQASPASNITIM